VDADRLPTRGRCSLVARDLGDMRVKVFVRAASADDEAGADFVRKALAAIDAQYREMFETAKDETAADWLLWVERGEVKLYAGTGMAWAASGPNSAGAAERKIYAAYALPGAAIEDPDPLPLARRLAHDMQTIFTWRNVWRIAGSAAGPAADARVALKVDVYLDQKDGKKQLQPGSALQPPKGGVKAHVQLTNDGDDPLWVSVLGLEANMRIIPFGVEPGKPRAIALEPHQSLALPLGKLTSDPFGKEGLVILAVPHQAGQTAPDYSFLKQDGFHPKGALPLARSVPGAPRTPFEGLLHAAWLGRGSRSIDVEAPSNPFVRTWSWSTLPPP
jgi:hypothetical protein